VIVVAGDCIARITAAAERAYPEECCGLLIGRSLAADDLRVTNVAESANVSAANRRRRFEVDPAVRFALMRRLRGTAECIVGLYHSHPDGTAEPSAHDVAMAFEPELLWLIVAVDTAHAGDIRCWRWDPVSACFRHRPYRLQDEGS
jgi:proteasome lid subunit RPN8/RPN11